ncbi:MAG: DUF2062 domain-containing protein [Hyphomicrobiaceae bacterium]|nr:DUF2062 domain-containing protein [Hyphomicrobiaceae bacterium]
MLFKRRVRPTMRERLATWLWPRRSWRRSARYVLHRILRLRSTPHSLALGAAVGVFVSCTPLLGGQMLLAAVIALAARASAPAALLATFFGNPLSWPLIWGATYATGTQIVGEAAVLDAGQLSSHADLLWEALLVASPDLLTLTAALIWPLFMPMLAGSLPVGLLMATAIYYMIRSMARGMARARHAPAERGSACGSKLELAEQHVQSR